MKMRGVEQIDYYLNKSVASIVSNESSSGEINYDCNSSCNTSILDQTDENINSNDTLLPLYEIGPNRVPKSLNKIYKDLLEERNQYINKIYYCKTCKQLFQDKSCNICNNDCIYFITLDVVYQIKE
jgi:hypothetical protein